jgi:hypothetical protein
MIDCQWTQKDSFAFGTFIFFENRQGVWELSSQVIDVWSERTSDLVMKPHGRYDDCSDWVKNTHKIRAEAVDFFSPIAEERLGGLENAIAAGSPSQLASETESPALRLFRSGPPLVVTLVFQVDILDERPEDLKRAFWEYKPVKQEESETFAGSYRSSLNKLRWNLSHQHIARLIEEFQW